MGFFSDDKLSTVWTAIEGLSDHISHAEEDFGKSNRELKQADFYLQECLQKSDLKNGEMASILIGNIKSLTSQVNHLEDVLQRLLLQQELKDVFVAEVPSIPAIPAHWELVKTKKNPTAKTP